MIKRINSTGRRRIMRDHAKISIVIMEDGRHSFFANLDLTPYDFPPNADVFVEAHRQSTLMRFPFGKASYPKASSPPVLSDFKNPEGILFRVKIIDVAERKGMLLAEGDIPVSNDTERPEDRVPLLPPRAADLGNELWRLDIPLLPDAAPQLLINEKLPDWKATAQTAEFRALVFPAAIRQVLERIYLSDDAPAIEDEGWSNNWIKFAESIPGVEQHPPISDENDTIWSEWIDTVCDRFAGKFGLLDTFTQQMEEDELR